MSWTEKMQEWGGANVTFLTEDGECITFMAIDEPYLIRGKFEDQDTQRIGCPIITQEGFTLLIIGRRVARRLSKHESSFNTQAFTLIRHGEHGDLKCKYELVFEDDKKTIEELQAIKARGVSAEEIAEAVSEAEEIATGK